MYTGMEWWTRIRLEVWRGEESKREVLRDERIHWETLKKILEHSEPPGYRLKEPRPKPKIGPSLIVLSSKQTYLNVFTMRTVSRHSSDISSLYRRHKLAQNS